MTGAVGAPVTEGNSSLARPQLHARPNRAQAETRLRDLVSGTACTLKLAAERALQSRLESWANHQPDTFHSAVAHERVHANEVRFIHVLRDASWGSTEQQTSLISLLSSAMAQDFATVNGFIESNAWIMEAFHHCDFPTSRLTKPPARLTDIIVELKKLIVWHGQLDVLPSQLCAGLLQVSVGGVRRLLIDSVQRRAAELLTQVTDAVDRVRADMRRVMREIPAEFGGGDAWLSRWYYRITSLIKHTWSRFEPVGTALRCLALLRHANWQKGHGTAALLDQLDRANQQLTKDWGAYLNALYSRHSALLAELDKRIPDAHRFHEKALNAAESVRRQADHLPRWLGPSDVIMKALIPGFDAEMAERLESRIGHLLEDVVQLTQLMAELDRVMEEVDETERVIQLLFHRTVESRQARRTYRRVSEKVAVWISLRDLLALARLWLTDMRNSELRTLLTRRLNAWQQRRRHFISDVAAERQSVRFWRDRMEEVRRLVVMMDAVKGEGTGGDDWSPIVGRMRYLMEERERASDTEPGKPDAGDADIIDQKQQDQQQQEQDQDILDKAHRKTEAINEIEKDVDSDLVENEKRQGQTATAEEKDQETLTRHVSVIYEQVSRSQKSFSAKELVETMDAKLDAMTFTMQRYVPEFIKASGALVDDVVNTISDGSHLETEVMFQLSALRAVTEWNLTSSWWRSVLATNERWGRAALVVRRLVGLQRHWMRLHRLVATGVVDAPPVFTQLTATFCGLTGRLQCKPRLCAHDFSQMLAELRAADNLMSQCLSAAGPYLEQVVRSQHHWPEGQGVPTVLSGDMERQLRVQAEQEGLVLHSGLLEWLVALHEQLSQRRIAVVTGEPGSGKSTLLGLLRAAKQQILTGSVDDVYLSNGAARVIDLVLMGPRPLERLVGLARRMGTLPMVEEWLIIDHDWPALDEVLAALAPVVEQNHNLVLVLETTQLDQHGPGDRHVPWFSLSPHKLSWRMLACAWFEQVAKTTLYRYELETLKLLTEQLFPDMLVFLSQHHTTLSRGRHVQHLVSGYLGCHQVAMFQQLFTALMASYDTLLIRKTADTRRVLRRVAALAFVWSFGGALERRHRVRFAEIARRLMATAELDFPTDGCVLEHALDAQANWCRWPAVTGGHVTTGGRQWHVPVPEQGSVASLAVRLLRCGVDVLLLGPRGAGKTQLLRHEVAPRFQAVSLDHAPYASAATARRYLQTLCRRIQAPIPRPAVIVDDLHYATDEPGGTGFQHLLREHCRLHGFRSGADLEFRSTGVLPVFATAVDVLPPVVAEPDVLAAVAIDARLRRHFFVLTLPAPDAALVAAIFSPVVQHGIWKHLPAEVASTEALFTHCWVDATCRALVWLQTSLPANATRPSRAFNLHHVTRCMRLALESASRLLQSETNKDGGGDDRFGNGSRGSSSSNSSNHSNSSDSCHDTNKHGVVREPMWKLALRVLPESWSHAAASVFSHRLECASDRTKFTEETDRIFTDVKKCVEAYEEERNAKDVKQVTDQTPTKASISTTTTATKDDQDYHPHRSVSKLPVTSESHRKHSRTSNSDKSVNERKRHSSKTHAPTETRISNRKSRTKGMRRSSIKVQKYGNKSVANKKENREKQLIVKPSICNDMQRRDLESMSITRRRSYQSFARSNHFSTSTAVSAQRERLNQERYGTITYQRPKSRYVDFTSFSNRRSRASNGFSSSTGGRFSKRADSQTSELQPAPEQQHQQPTDELNQGEATRLWQTLASCLIQQRFSATGVEVAAVGTLEGLLDVVMSRFAAQHPDRLPCALPPAVLRLLLTLTEALSAGGGCSLLLRGRRTPGLRTVVQLACFVTQQQLIDLRPHMAKLDDTETVLCRCVLAAMFGEQHQCLYVTESSAALKLVHAVVTARLPLQLLASDVWRTEAERLGFGRRLRHLERRGTLLTVAGDTILRRLHVIVSCSVADGAGGSHFPELRLLARWPSFFRATVLSLPDWPAVDYLRVARRYLGTLDGRLATASVAELLVTLHLDACEQLQQKRLNSLSLLYQLCEAFVVSFSMLHQDTTCRLERVTQQVSQLEAVRRVCAELGEQVADMQQVANLLQEEQIARKRYMSEVDTHIRHVRTTESELTQQQTSTTYRLHQQHELLDQLQPEVDQLRAKMDSLRVATEFGAAFAEICQFEEPPEAVLIICQCVCVLMDKEFNWETAKQLLQTSGIRRVCRLISLDIVTESHLDHLEQLLPDADRDSVRQQLQEQCASAVELLDWLLQLTAAGRCHHRLASAAVQSIRLSDEFVRLQTALLETRQKAERLQELRRVAVERLQQSTEQLHMARRQLRHAGQRRDWLSRLETALWRPAPAPDGSRAVGPRLHEELGQLTEVSRHLPAAAALLAAAATFWTSGGAETCRLQRWLQLLACRQPESCTCPGLWLPVPAPSTSQLAGLSKQLRDHLTSCPPWFSRHPLTVETARFVRRCLLPAWYSELPESTEAEDGDRLSVLILSVALRRPSTRLIVVSDPETKLDHGLRHLGHQLRTVTEAALLHQMPGGTPTDSNGADATADATLEDAWKSEQRQQEVINNVPQPGKSETIVNDTGNESQQSGEIINQSQQAVLDHTSMVSIEDTATVNIDSLLKYVSAGGRRLVVRYSGDASSLTERLLSACRGRQHLVSHLDLSPSSEVVSALVGPMVVHLLRPQAHRDQRTYLDDLKYWEARRSAAQRRLLAQWPELLRLLDQLLQAGRHCPVRLPERTVPPPVDLTAMASPAVKTAPRLQRPQRERPTLELSVVQLRNGKVAGSSITGVSLAAAVKPRSPASDTVQLSAKLKRRRRETRASLELAHTWRERLERLERNQKSTVRFDSQKPRTASSFEPSHVLPEQRSQPHLGRAPSTEQLMDTRDNPKHTETVELTESVVTLMETKQAPTVSFKIDDNQAIIPGAGRSIANKDAGEADDRPRPSKEGTTSADATTTGDVQPPKNTATRNTVADVDNTPNADAGGSNPVRGRRRRRRHGFHVGSLVPNSSGSVLPALVAGRRRSRHHSSSSAQQRRQSRRRISSAPTPRDHTPQPLVVAGNDGDSVQPSRPATGARRRLASLRQCEVSLLQMVAEVDALDAGAFNCRHHLAQLVRQRAPLQPIVTFFSGLYTAVAALGLQSTRLTLDHFVGWLASSLRTRASTKAEDPKSADYFRLLGVSDVVPRVLERLPTGRRRGYLLLAALLAAGWTDAARLRLLVHGPPSCDGWHQRWLPACPAWATERQWLALGALSRQVPAVRRLVATLRDGDDDGWQARLAAGPDVLDRGGLAAGDWALVWRALQPDAMPDVVEQLINCVLGPAPLHVLAELDATSSNAEQALDQVSRIVTVTAYSGLTMRLMEKLATYVRQLLALLRQERHNGTAETPSDKQCAWARYLGRGQRLARAQVRRIHDELVEVRRLLSARVAPTARLEALVTCLAERSTPPQWEPAGGASPGRLPQLLRHLLASVRHVQQLVEQTPRLWKEPSEPLQLRLGLLPRPAECLPSLREAVSARLGLPVQQVTVTVVDEQHPAPASGVHVWLDMRHVHSEQRAQLVELCAGWRRRPRTKHVLLALCPTTELGCVDDRGAPAETESVVLPPLGPRARARSVVDPTMKKFVEKIRLSVG